MKRKRFFKKGFISFILIAALAGYYAWQIEPHWVKYEQLKLPIRHLPENLEGKTLVQISDIHIGDYVDKDFIKNSFKKIKKISPDIIVYTGDFVRLTNNDLPLDDLDDVMQAAPKGKILTVAILGNHDYGRAFRDSAAADSITALITKHQIRVLRNERANAAGLLLYGMDDYWGTNFDPIKTMQNYDSKQASLVICHNPDVADLDVWNGYEGWILSGHTHAGQVRIPFWGSPIIPVSNKNYDQGVKKLDGNRTLYINRGLGHSIPIRFNARPEISLFTLTRG